MWSLLMGRWQIAWFIDENSRVWLYEIYFVQDWDFFPIVSSASPIFEYIFNSWTKLVIISHIFLLMRLFLISLGPGQPKIRIMWSYIPRATSCPLATLLVSFEYRSVGKIWQWKIKTTEIRSLRIVADPAFGKLINHQESHKVNKSRKCILELEMYHYIIYIKKNINILKKN